MPTNGFTIGFSPAELTSGTVSIRAIFVRRAFVASFANFCHYSSLRVLRIVIAACSASLGFKMLDFSLASIALTNFATQRKGFLIFLLTALIIISVEQYVDLVFLPKTTAASGQISLYGATNLPSLIVKPKS